MFSFYVQLLIIAFQKEVLGKSFHLLPDLAFPKSLSQLLHINTHQSMKHLDTCAQRGNCEAAPDWY